MAPEVLVDLAAGATAAVHRVDSREVVAEAGVEAVVAEAEGEADPVDERDAVPLAIATAMPRLSATAHAASRIASPDLCSISWQLGSERTAIFA